jgi:hypothetical protein
MTPNQQVSKFLCNRANFLRDMGRFDEALQAVDAAERFNSINPACWPIRFDILNKMQDRRGSQPVPLALQTAPICIGAGHAGVLGNLAALLSHTMNPQSPQAPAGRNNEPSRAKIRNAHS